MEGVSWETYEALRNDLDAAGQHFYITYDQGEMHVMAPLVDHEFGKTVLGRLVEMLALERRIPIRGTGSTTLKRRDLRKGLEPDESYYIQNVSVMIGKRELDLRKDLPPDLAIEVESTYAPKNKPSIYAALGVNEIWRYDGKQIITLVLDKSVNPHAYQPREFSAAFPFLRPADLLPFVTRAYDIDDTTLALEFRAWVNKKLRRKKGKKK